LICIGLAAEDSGDLIAGGYCAAVVNPVGVVKTEESATPSLSVTPVVTRTWYVVDPTNGAAGCTEYVIESVELGAADIWTQVAKLSDDNCNVPLQVVSAVLTVRDAGVVERLNVMATGVVTEISVLPSAGDTFVTASAAFVVKPDELVYCDASACPLASFAPVLTRIL
jgi:hypothetical protein